MATNDTCCTIVPYFKVENGKLDEFRVICKKLVEQTSTEPDCLYYGCSFNGDLVHVREGYKNGEALLAHLENVGAILEEGFQISKIVRLEVHGPEEELAKLREPLASLNPEFFTLEYGFRK